LFVIPAPSVAPAANKVINPMARAQAALRILVFETERENAALGAPDSVVVCMAAIIGLIWMIFPQAGPAGPVNETPRPMGLMQNPCACAYGS
jgi:hypothetical protein